MIVVLDIQAQTCTVTREESDPRFDPTYRKGTWGNGESRLLYHVKKELEKQGHDLVKKRMWKDGHMYGAEETQYLRTRNKKCKRPHFYVYDREWAVRNSAEEFNKLGTVVFGVATDIFDVED